MNATQSAGGPGLRQRPRTPDAGNRRNRQAAKTHSWTLSARGGTSVATHATGGALSGAMVALAPYYMTYGRAVGAAAQATPPPLWPYLAVGAVVGAVGLGTYGYLKEVNKAQQRTLDRNLDSLRRHVAGAQNDYDFVLLEEAIDDNDILCRDADRLKELEKIRIDLYQTHVQFLTRRRQAPADVSTLPPDFAAAQTRLIATDCPADPGALLRPLRNRLPSLQAREVIPVAGFYATLARHYSSGLIGDYWINQDHIIILKKHIVVLREEAEMQPDDSVPLTDPTR